MGCDCLRFDMDHLLFFLDLLEKVEDVGSDPSIILSIVMKWDHVMMFLEESMKSGVFQASKERLDEIIYEYGRD